MRWKQESGEYWRLTGIALAYHALGRSRDSNAALTQLIKDHQQFMAYQIAEVYAYRGEFDKAFQNPARGCIPRSFCEAASARPDLRQRLCGVEPEIKITGTCSLYAPAMPLIALRAPTPYVTLS